MFYVYAWYNVKTKIIFYVGKGTRERYKQVRKRNRLFKKYYAENECDVKIIKYFESEQEALAYEHKHIVRLKKKGQCMCNLDDGGKGGMNFVWNDSMKEYQSKYNPMKEPEQRKRMSKYNPMKNKEVSELVASKNKRAVVINGKYFDGVVDAAEYYDKAVNQIVDWCKRGFGIDRVPCRYADEKQKPIPLKKTNDKPVIIDGVKYKSVKTAAEHYGVWSETIIRAIKEHRKFKGHTCEYGNQ